MTIRSPMALAYASMPNPSHMGCGIPAESPCQRLTSILKSRGYRSAPTPSMEYLQPGKGGNNKGKQPSPSALRLASYGTAVLRAAHKSNAAALRTLLGAGLSPNPCNAFHDDVLHIVCKRGDYDTFSVLNDAGASWHVCDSLGRTPLHHCCWSDDRHQARSHSGLGALDIAAAVIERDPSLLLLSDHRGRTPLDFVASERWALWNAFLDRNAERYWPRGGAGGRNGEVDVAAVLPRDPNHALSPEEAVAVAAGKADPAPLAERRLRRMAQARHHDEALRGGDGSSSPELERQYHNNKRKLDEATYICARQQHHQHAAAVATAKSSKAKRRTFAGRCA